MKQHAGFDCDNFIEEYVLINGLLWGELMTIPRIIHSNYEDLFIPTTCFNFAMISNRQPLFYYADVESEAVMYSRLLLFQDKWCNFIVLCFKTRPLYIMSRFARTHFDETSIMRSSLNLMIFLKIYFSYLMVILVCIKSIQLNINNTAFLC